MTDRDRILLAIGCSIGLVTSFGVFYLLVFADAWVQHLTGRMKIVPSTSSRRLIFSTILFASIDRWELYGTIAMAVFVLSTCLGGVAAKELFGW